MTLASDRQVAIIRTERGLTVDGTRITLYDVMDYVRSQYPPKLIGDILSLTDEQVTVALSYLETNRAEVETEYQMILQEAEEIRQYWEERNRDRLAEIAKLSPPPDREAAWQKLQTQKANLQTKRQVPSRFMPLLLEQAHP
jgi:uncharacterized protein (DUF433 family)